MASKKYINDFIARRNKRHCPDWLKIVQANVVSLHATNYNARFHNDGSVLTVRRGKMCGQARAGNIRVLVVLPKKVEIVLVVTDHFVKSSQNIFIQCN